MDRNMPKGVWSSCFWMLLVIHSLLFGSRDISSFLMMIYDDTVYVPHIPKSSLECLRIPPP